MGSGTGESGPALRRRNMTLVLEHLATIEAASRAVPSTRRSRPVHVSGLHATPVRRRGAAPVDALPQDNADEHADAELVAPWSTEATVAASSVRLAKFAATGAIQARAFYLPRWGPKRTVKFVVGEEGPRGSLRREIDARTAIAKDGSEAIGVLPMLDHGTVGESTYLVEPAVFGRHADGGEKAQTACAVIDGLLAGYRTTGLRDERYRPHAKTVQRLTGLLEQPFAANAVAADVLLGRVEELLGRGARIPTGWCHGDLVFSNIILLEDGTHQLVDWEYAWRGPVIADLTKLMLSVKDLWSVLDHLERSVTPADIGPRPGRYGLAEQIALMTIRELSWWQSRHASAVAAGRLRQFRTAQQRRMRLLEATLGHLRR